MEIAIAGAGPAGLACATALACDGHRVAVFERFDESRPIGLGLMLQPTDLAALHRLGLRGAVEALGERIDRLHGVTDRGWTVFDLDYASLDPGLYAIGIHRAALHGVLWQAFVGSGARLETGHTMVRVEERTGGRAALIDAKGLSSAVFDLVVDATGARSRLRAGVTGANPRPLAYGAVWASVPDPGLAPGALAQRYVAARRMAGVLPVGRVTPGGPKLAALFWSLKASAYPHWSANFAQWRDEIVTLWPGLATTVAGLNGPDDFTLASYIHVTARQPFLGPVVLLGDAAHATSPQLGQGANHALLDALALTDALRKVPDVASALARYAAVRRGHVRFYQTASALMTPLFQSDSRLAAILRDLTFDRLERVPYLKREMLRTLAGLKTGLLTHASATALAGS